MKIGTRAEALAIHKARPATELTRFDRGKYKWHGSSAHYLGREVPDIRGVLAVFVARRQDADGPYTAVMAVSERTHR